MAADGGEDDIDTRRLGRVVRDTQQTVVHTGDRVESLRKELTQRIDSMDIKFDELDAKVDGLEVSGARIEGKVDVLLEDFAVAREERSKIRVSAVQASIEVEKTGEIAKVQEAVAVRADRRQLLLKAVAVLGPLAAAALTWMLSRC